MKIIVDETGENIRIDSFLASLLPDVSRSQIKKGIDGVNVNGKPVKASYVLKLDDIIEGADFAKEVFKIYPQDIPLEVVWEDENMAVVNKPSGMLTHPTTLETEGTLVNALLFKYGENLSDINGVMRRGIVHRLDRNTSGLIMIAKNNKTHEFLVEEMKEKRFLKKYIAIVRGVVEKDEFEINSPIGRNPNQPHKQCITSDGKDALTIVKVLKRFKEATFVELTLVTGRTHQIRVHLSSIGHPVYNDTLYGFGKMKVKTEEQVLESYKLEFTKPFTKERIFLEIPPDEKFVKVFNKIN